MHHHDDSLDTLRTFLRRSRCVAQTALAGCGLGWLALAFWLLYQHPERLGAARLGCTLALVVITAASACVWWFAASWQRWLYYVVTAIVPHLRHTPDAGRNGAAKLANLADLNR